MEKELIEFIKKNELKPFSKSKTSIKTNGKNIFKTKDAKSVHNRALNVISKDFVFKDTENLFDFFEFPSNMEEVIKRQEFFKSAKKFDRVFLQDLKEPRPFWNPNYGIVVVTEEDSTFRELKDLGCNVKFIVNEMDVQELERYDIVQVLECENFSLSLEQLPQSVFLNSVEEAYLERFVRELSGWKNNFEIMKNLELPEEMKKLVEELKEMFYLLDAKEKNKMTREKVEEGLYLIKEEIGRKVKELSISGEILMGVLNNGTLPAELKKIVDEAIAKTGLPQNLFLKEIPVKVDEKELETTLRNQSLNEFANEAEEIKKNAKRLCKVSEKLKTLENLLVLFDFESAVAEWNEGKEFPQIADVVFFKEAFNEFLEKPSPIGFELNESFRCSILTGANSGGKTTLLEHFIQMISYSYLGLPVKGNLKIPVFSEIYYFAKNKGSASKGAFETLLTQMSQISSGNKTLILADEIEAVTEPGVAGKMISATANFFIEKGCFLIFATHLGQEIQKILPERARIDGIEARGLDENNELIVEHNPVMGRLASSTPELIVEKMARNSENEYFRFLNGYLESLKIRQKS